MQKTVHHVELVPGITEINRTYAVKFAWLLNL